MPWLRPESALKNDDNKKDSHDPGKTEVQGGANDGDHDGEEDDDDEGGEEEDEDDDPEDDQEGVFMAFTSIPTVPITYFSFLLVKQFPIYMIGFNTDPNKLEKVLNPRKGPTTTTRVKCPNPLSPFQA